MPISFPRAAWRTAFVCLALASLSTVISGGEAIAGTGRETTRSARGVDANERTSLDGSRRGHDRTLPVTIRAGEVDLLAYAPGPIAASAARARTIVYLHGARGLAEKGCPFVQPGASEIGWLVCPEAIRREPGGTWSWGGDALAQGAVVTRAMRAAAENGASSDDAVAVGFSQGSYVALDLVKARLVRFSGLVLLGAEVHPSAERLREAGVLRVALGAGRRDAAYASLRDEARVLSSAGVETRFVDLGDVGHTYAAEDTRALREAIAWAGGVE